MDIRLVSSATIEALLLFIGAIEGEVVALSEMDAKFNAQRIEIQGQKPQQKIKRLMLPQRKFTFLLDFQLDKPIQE